MKKKLIALALVLALLFGLCGTALAASLQTKALPDPIILIPGYTAIQLFENPASEDRELVWSLDFSAVGNEILKELPGLLAGAALYPLTNKVLTQAFAKAAERVLGVFTVGADGRSLRDVGPFPGTAAECSLEALRANHPNLLHLKAFGNNFEKKVPADRIFIFQYDWRNPSVQTAKQLRAFIKEVKAYTGAAKVRLFGSSYGGQMCGVYLYDYAKDLDVSKVVLEFPALGGSSAIADLLLGKDVRIQVETLTRFIQSYMGTEIELDPLTKWITAEPLGGLLSDLLLAGFLPVVKNWGSLWDLIPADQYDTTKAAVLAPGEHYAWEAESDRLHHEIMPNVGETLRKAQEQYGIAVRIVANSGSLHLLGDYCINSDGLLDVQYTTGASALPLGEHGIAQSNTVCKNPAHNHLSPGQDIDASAAWLPENTWFVQGQYHGASYMDPYALALESELMLRDDLNTVWDDPDYPQFGACRQPSENIAFSANLKEGTVTIENLSELYDLQVLAVTVPGLFLPTKAIPPQKAAPGTSVTIALSGLHTLQAGTYIPVTIRYLQYTEGVPVPKTKVFDLTA